MLICPNLRAVRNFHSVLATRKKGQEGDTSGRPRAWWFSLACISILLAQLSPRKMMEYSKSKNNITSKTKKFNSWYNLKKLDGKRNIWGSNHGEFAFVTWHFKVTSQWLRTCCVWQIKSRLLTISRIHLASVFFRNLYTFVRHPKLVGQKFSLVLRFVRLVLELMAISETFFVALQVTGVCCEPILPLLNLLALVFSKWLSTFYFS